MILYHSKLGSNPDNIKYLADGIKSNNSIKELNLPNNSLGNNLENMKYLCDALKTNSTIHLLKLYWDSLGNFDISKLENGIVKISA